MAGEKRILKPVAAIRRFLAHPTRRTLSIGAVAAIVVIAAAASSYALILGGQGSSGSGTVDLSKGLTGWWKCNGNVKDSTPYQNNGTITGGVTYTADHEGAANGACNFDGASGTQVKVTPAAAKPLLTNNFTASVWVKGVASSGSTNSTGTILDYTGDSGAPGTIGASVFDIVVSANGMYDFGGVNGYNAVNNLFGVAASSTTWYLLTVSYDGTNAYLYVNGALKDTYAIGSFTASTTNASLYIGGAAYVGYRNISGAVSDARVYNRALSQAEVTALYQQYNPSVNLDSGQSGLIDDLTCNGSTKNATPYQQFTTVGSVPLVADREGTANSACSFTGVNNYVQQTPLPNVFGSNQFTMSFWFNQQSIDSGWINPIAASYDLDHSNNYGFFCTTGNNILHLNCSIRLPTGDGSTYTQVAITPSYTVALNTWYLFTITFDGDKGTLYVNGVNQGSVSGLSSSISGRSISTLGPVFGKGNTGTTANEYLSDVRIYNRALSAQEISTLYHSYDSQVNLQSSPQNNTTVNLNSGLIGYWPFNGNAKDATPQQNNGTVTNAALTTDRKGKANSAYAFAGSSDTENIAVGTAGTYPNLTTTGFTMSVWYEMLGNSYAGYPWLMTFGNSHIYYGLRSEAATNGNDIGFEYGVSPYDGASGNYHTFGTVLESVGTWHLYTATYNGTTVAVYVDGVLQNNTTVALNPSHGALTFGSATAANGPDGAIDDARLYDRALSATEVRALYNNYY